VLQDGWNFLFSVTFILATNKKMETYFDYNAEPIGTIEQKFSNL